jgi:C1A family cysteine protease
MNKAFAVLAIALIGLGVFTSISEKVAEKPTEESWTVQSREVELFQLWKATHGKSYSNMEEEMFRMKVFLETKAFV